MGLHEKKSACWIVLGQVKIWEKQDEELSSWGHPRSEVLEVNLFAQFHVIYKNFRNPLSLLTKTRKFPICEILSYTCVLFLSVKYLYCLPTQTPHILFAFPRDVTPACSVSILSLSLSIWYSKEKKNLGLNLNHSLAASSLLASPLIASLLFKKTFYFILEYSWSIKY